LDELRDEVEFELGQLRRLIESLEPTISKSLLEPPDPVVTLALAGFLHSFCTGAENILKRIVLHLEGRLPKGEAWHAQLLEEASRPSPTRLAVIPADLA